MKKFILLLMVCLIPSLLMAKPVSVLSQYVHDAIADQTGESVLMGKFMRGKTVRVAIYAPSSPDKVQEYGAYVQRHYNVWFNSTADIIRASGRKDFDDLLPRLSRPVKMQFVTEKEEYDVVFRFVSWEEMQKACGGAAMACVFGYGRVPVFYGTEDLLSAGGKIDFVTLHEIGHTLGLGDQYASGRNTSYTDANYAGIVQEESIMNAASISRLVVEKITEDDADGIILAADLALHNYDRGGQKGWKSLVPGSKQYYVYGKVGNSPYSFSIIDEPGAKDFMRVSFVKYNEKGKPGAVKKMEFAQKGLNMFSQPKASKVLVSDNVGRPIKEVGPNGETIYTAYFYESTRKLVVNKENQVIFYSNEVRKDTDTEGVVDDIVSSVFVGKGDDVAKLEKTFYNGDYGKGGEIIYSLNERGRKTLYSIKCSRLMCQVREGKDGAWEFADSSDFIKKVMPQEELEPLMETLKEYIGKEIDQM